MKLREEKRREDEQKERKEQAVEKRCRKLFGRKPRPTSLVMTTTYRERDDDMYEDSDEMYERREEMKIFKKKKREDEVIHLFIPNLFICIFSTSIVCYIFETQKSRGLRLYKFICYIYNSSILCLFYIYYSIYISISSTKPVVVYP